MNAPHQDQAERERTRSAADAFLALRDSQARPALPQLRQAGAKLRIPHGQAAFARRLAVGMMRLSPAMTDAGWRRLNAGLYLMSRRRFATLCTGDRLQVDLLDFIGSRLFHFGVWEPNITAVIMDTLRPGDVFCDVGANIGYYTVLASRLVGPGGHVVAVEPSPAALRVLRDNIALNGLTNVRVVPAAVAAERGRLALYAPSFGNAGTTSTVARDGRSLQAEVDALRLAQILTRDELARLRLVKIDVEGGEGAVLASILQDLAAFSFGTDVLAELSVDAALPGAADANDLVARFNAAGFRSSAIANSYEIRSYLEFRAPMPPQDLRLPITAQMDVLFSRRSRAGGE
ncbi:FkbM family methyltransferase [Neoroseomonas rubea]|uniref:FkbM family methyltransferase n=1 Tax=Neoroseomonas rubea TaxID=2748666 RepID=UPI0018DFCC84|nr:FkbM family methyltransferase [Roseomonas rubea]